MFVVCQNQGGNPTGVWVFEEYKDALAEAQGMIQAADFDPEADSVQLFQVDNHNAGGIPMLSGQDVEELLPAR